MSVIHSDLLFVCKGGGCRAGVVVCLVVGAAPASSGDKVYFLTSRHEDQVPMKASVKRLLTLTLLALIFPASASADWTILSPGQTIRIPCYENAKSILIQTPQKYGSRELHLDSYWTGSGGKDDWTTFYHLGSQFKAEGQADQGPDTWVKKTLIRNAGSLRLKAYTPDC